VQAGIVASTIANVNRPKDHKPFTPNDFMPQYDRPPQKEQTWQEMLAMFDGGFGTRASEQ